MENNNYLIIIAIKEGENFPIQETFRQSNSNRLHDDHNHEQSVSKTRPSSRIVFEAVLNEKALRSDFIPFNDSRPQLQTELAWQIDRKSLHEFRIERRPIKLKCYIIHDVNGSYSHMNGDNDRQPHMTHVGNVLFDLRSTQDILNPKFEWKILVNPHYRGDSRARPMISTALVLAKCEDDDNLGEGKEDEVKKRIEKNKDNANANASEDEVEIIEEIKSGDNNSIVVESRHSNSDFVILSQPCSKSTAIDDASLEYDLNVQLKNGHYHLWDSLNGTQETDCKQRFTISFTIASANVIHKLFHTQTQINASKPFHFRYTFLGTIIKTQPFFDIGMKDFSVQKTSFRIATPSWKTLKIYLEFHPTLDIQLFDSTDEAHGFVSIPMNQFFEEEKVEPQQNDFEPIHGSFLMFPHDESIQVSDPFPTIGIAIELTPESSSSNQHSDNGACLKNPKSPLLKSDHFQFHDKLSSTPIINHYLNQQSSAKANPKADLKKPNFSMKHYCVTIDLRKIKMIDPNLPPIDASYLQFSYAFFGLTDTIKTFPFIRLSHESDVIIPHGFCTFNFATTQAQLEKTFTTIPLIIEVIEKGIHDTLIGTTKIELFRIFDSSPTGKDAKQLMYKTLPVLNEESKPIAQLEVIIALQNLGETQIPPVNRPADVSVLKHNVNNNSIHIDNSSVENIKDIDDLLVEAALEIETWKDNQLSVFREEMKQKEIEYSKKFEERLSKREKELKSKLNEVSQIEARFIASLNEVKDKEENLKVKEAEISDLQKVLNTRYGKLNGEISVAIEDIKEHYENKLVDERNRGKEVETEKRRLQERIYVLERKVKERERQVKELEERLLNRSNKTSSVTSVRHIQVGGQSRPSTTISPLTSPKKVGPGNASLMTNGHVNPTSVRSRSQSYDRSNVFSGGRNISNSSATNSRIVGKEINIKENKNKMKEKEKLEVMKRIKLEKQDLLKAGLSKDHDLIVEIDEKLKTFKLL